MLGRRRLACGSVNRVRQSQRIWLTAAAFLLAAVPYSDAYAVIHKATSTATLVRAAPSGETGLVDGDTLKISFYEHLGSQASSSQPTFSNLVEHTEMSGNYVLHLDGTINVPLIGAVKAVGLTPEELEGKLKAKSHSLFKRTVTVIVRLIGREPVYVTGSVPQPGVFSYRPEMVALQAMILAGVRTAGPEGTRRLDALPEMVRLRKSAAMLPELIARRDVLVALRDANEVGPSSMLIKLVGRISAESYIGAARRLADLEVNKVKIQEAGIRHTSAAIKSERKLMELSLKDAESALHDAAARFKFVSAKRNRDIMTEDAFYQAVDGFDASRARVNRIRVSIAHLDQRILQLQQKKALTISDAAIARQRQIDNLDSSITEMVITTNSLAPVLAFTSTAFRRTEPPEVKILRQSQAGIVKINATELTVLRPGDIVEVIKEAPDSLAGTTALDRANIGDVNASPSREDLLSGVLPSVTR